MSKTNVEVVQRVFDAYAAEDYAAALALCDPEIEWVPMEGAGEVFRGYEGLGRAIVEWEQSWGDHSAEAEEFIDAGGDKVIAVVRISGRGPRSGVTVEQRFFQVYTLRDGRVVHMMEYLERAEALEAAGLSG
jgi:ketosteroid isomerase-like protein